MYVHSNKILIMEFSAGFKDFLVQNAVAQKLLSILIFTTITNTVFPHIVSAETILF